MGHFCWICGRVRANERFSGRGHRKHECRDCQLRVSPDERARLQSTNDLIRIFDQTNISERNVAFARKLLQDDDLVVRQLAQLVVDVGTLRPRRRRRNGFIATNHPELWRRMLKAGVAGEEHGVAPDAEAEAEADGGSFFERERWHF